LLCYFSLKIVVFQRRPALGVYAHCVFLASPPAGAPHNQD
jgi:hypothetical protein